MSTAPDHVQELAKAQAEKKRFRAWFESAMMMVDNTPAPLMWANAEDGFKISYMNAAGRKSLEALQVHTGVGPGEMDGATLQRLFGDQAHVLPDLADASRLPWRGRVTFGPEFADFNIRAISDRKGTYCGAMVTWSVVTRRVNLIQKFEHEVFGVSEEIGQATESLVSSADAVRSRSQESSRGAEAVASAILEVSSNLDDLAAAGDSLVEAINDIGERGRRTSETSRTIAEQAGNADEKVSVLAAGTSQIGDVLRLINEIANQTNLLALNATIEAARAGEAGRGFAVVAKEVKSLSTKTAEAISDIEQQIRGIESATEGAVAAIREIRASIDAVSESGAEIGAAVEGQTQSTERMQSLIQESRRHAQDVSRHTQAVARTIAEAGQTAETVHAEIAELGEVSDRLRGRASEFLQQIRGG